MTALRPPRTARRTAGDVIVSGVTMGLAAGATMAVVWAIKAGLLGLGVWLPMKSVAAIAWGVDALIAGAGVVLAGVAFHLAVSAGWGVLFAAMVGPRTQPGTAMVLGLAYGALVWLAMAFFVVPAVNPVMAARVELLSFAFFLVHLIFGAVLALVPRAQARRILARGGRAHGRSAAPGSR